MAPVVHPKDALLEKLRDELRKVNPAAVQDMLIKMKEVTLLKADLLSKVDIEMAKARTEVYATTTTNPKLTVNDSDCDPGAAKDQDEFAVTSDAGPLPSDLTKRIGKVLERIGRGLVERSQESQMVLLAALSGEHLLLLGPPGTAKSELARRLSSVFSDGGYFERLLTKFSSPEELFGPLSIQKLEEDCYERMMTGYLPEASVAFVDEIFKANSAILNTLLSIMNERVFHNGSNPHQAPLICLVGASNEMPESEELEALFDRFLLRRWVNPLSSDGFLDYIGGMSGNEELKPQLPPPSTAAITHEDVLTVRRCASKVEIPEEVMDRLLLIRHFTGVLKDPPCYVSDRRWKKIMYLLQVLAATSGRATVVESDLLMLQHCLWSHPSHLPIFNEFLKTLLEQRDRTGPLFEGAPSKVLLGSCVRSVHHGAAGVLCSVEGDPSKSSSKGVVAFAEGKGASLQVTVLQKPFRELMYCSQEQLFCSELLLSEAAVAVKYGTITWSSELLDETSLTVSEDGKFLKTEEKRHDYHTALCEPEMTPASGVYIWEVESVAKASNVKVGLCRAHNTEHFHGNMYETQCPRSAHAMIYYNEGKIFANLRDDGSGGKLPNATHHKAPKFDVGDKIKFTLDTITVPSKLEIEKIGKNGEENLVQEYDVNMDEPLHFFACTDYDNENFRITHSEHHPKSPEADEPSPAVTAPPVPAPKNVQEEARATPDQASSKGVPSEGGAELLSDAVQMVLNTDKKMGDMPDDQDAMNWRALAWPLVDEARKLLVNQYCQSYRYARDMAASEGAGGVALWLNKESQGLAEKHASASLTSVEAVLRPTLMLATAIQDGCALSKLQLLLAEDLDFKPFRAPAKQAPEGGMPASKLRIGPTEKQMLAHTVGGKFKGWWKLSTILIPQSPTARGEVKKVKVIVEGGHELTNWQLAAYTRELSGFYDSSNSDETFNLCWNVALPSIEGKGEGEVITVDVPPGYVADSTMFLAVQVVSGHVKLKIAGSMEIDGPTEEDGFFLYRYLMTPGGPGRSDAVNLKVDKPGTQSCIAFAVELAGI